MQYFKFEIVHFYSLTDRANTSNSKPMVIRGLGDGQEGSISNCVWVTGCLSEKQSWFGLHIDFPP